MTNDVSSEKLPTSLLEAISSPNGGSVVLVLGAGCSTEWPTNLPLSGDLSAECHEALVADGVLETSDVSDPRDLSEVASVVFTKTGNQEALVSRFPPSKFRLASPNEGYMTMAALLLEGALADAMTLNFDCAARTALALLGAESSVSVIRGPEDHGQLGTRNLIHLHRDIDRPADELILRTEVLDGAWYGHWEEVVAGRVLSGPVVVFVGLGSPASVLVETTKRISSAFDEPMGRVFVVGPSEHDDSRFASALGISPDEYIRMGWIQFMRELSHRVIQRHRSLIRHSCQEHSAGIGVEAQDLDDICDRLVRVGLQGLGQLRAAWMLHSGRYLPQQHGYSPNAFSFLLSGILVVEKETGLRAEFRADGLVEFSDGSYSVPAMVCSGGGWMTTARVEAELIKRYDMATGQHKAPAFALVSGVEDSPALSTPDNIAIESAPEDLLTGPENLAHIRFFRIAELLVNPSLIREVTT